MTKQERSKTMWSRVGWTAALTGLFQIIGVLRAIADDLDDDDEDYDALPGRTAEQIDALIFNFDEVVETIAVYASLMSELVIIFMLAVALRLKTWAVYIGLTILSMVWFALFEQLFTGLYWLGVDIGFSALVITGFVLASAHLVQAGLSLNPSRQFGRLRPVFFVLAIGIWGILAYYWPIRDLPPALLAVAALAMFGHIFAIPSFFARESVTVKVDRNGLVFGAIVMSALLAFVMFGEIAEDLDFVFLGRLILLSVVAFFSVFLVRHAIMLLWDRDARIKKERDAARRDAEQSRALLETEQKYSRARDAAQRHTRRLATASHDIRQPIGSLRSTVAALAKDQSDEVGSHLTAALDYLDQLAESYIDAEEEELSGDTPAQRGNKEVVASDMICATVDRMFRKEAEEKGLLFNATAEPASITTDPLAIMRILSNLLSNAIKHTPQGAITLQGVVKGNGYVFSVHNSANLPEHFHGEQMFEAYEKGAQSTGNGLGLSIVDTLSNRSGIDLAWASPPDEGTTFTVTIPEI